MVRLNATATVFAAASIMKLQPGASFSTLCQGSPRHQNHAVTQRRRRSMNLSVSSNPSDAEDVYDVVVVGSGIGGLCAAAMCSLYGYKTAVFESHYAPGGCAHGFVARAKGIEGDFLFDTGPSFFSGLNPTFPPKPPTPLELCWMPLKKGWSVRNTPVLA